MYSEPLKQVRVQILILVLVAALAVIVLAPAALGSPGDLDTTFGTGGKVTTDFASGSDAGHAIAIQTDGKIVVAGIADTDTGEDFAVARYFAKLEINTVAPGDINDDDSVDLGDAILSNQILCGITPAGSVHKGADVSGDGKIGTEEAIYVLQVVSGLKVVLVSIEVTPADPSVLPGNTVQFVATGFYSDNTKGDITDEVSWASSDTSVAAISAAAGSKGLATAVRRGTSTIYATKGSLSGSTIFTVTENARRFYLDPDSETLASMPYQLGPDILSQYENIFLSPKVYTTKISGDIAGGEYRFAFYLACIGTRTLNAEIVINPGDEETILASAAFSIHTEKFSFFDVSVTGIDPHIPSGGVLALRLKGDSAIYPVGLFFAPNLMPYIEVPPIDD